MAITHTFLDFIPSCFLGAPEESTVLSVLPAHKLLLKGRGYEAVKLTIYGSLFCLLAAIVVLPILLFSVPKFYPFLENYMAYVLILASIFLIFHERKSFKTL